MISDQQYGDVCRHLDSGLTAPKIEELTGVPRSTVYNIRRGKVKPPKAKRADAGSSKYEGREMFLDAVKEEFLSQSRRSQTLKSCVDNVRTRFAMAGINSEFARAPEATILNHVYSQKKREDWDTLWVERKHKHNYQTKLPKLRHDYWRQVGFMDYAVIDGRKADQWIARWSDRALEVLMPQTFAVMELRTRDFLHMSISDKAFNSHEVLELLLHTFLREDGYGRPKLGILCDNGQEQIGNDNVMAMELFWPRYELEQYRRGQGVVGFHDIFPGVLTPVVTSIPRVPTEWGKAALENSFWTIQKRMDAFTAGDAFQGGGRQDVIHRNLNRSIDKAHVREHNQVQKYVNALNWFITGTEPTPTGLTPYRLLERPKVFESFVKETGLRPTIEQAVAYCLQTHDRQEIPEENYAGILWAAGEKLYKPLKKAVALEFQYQRESVSLWSPALTEDLVGEEITVVFMPGQRHRAALFLGMEFLGWGSDLPEMGNAGIIPVCDMKKVGSELRKETMQRTRAKNKSVPERQHEIPALEPVEEVQVFQDYTNGRERPELDTSKLSEDMKRDLEELGIY